VSFDRTTSARKEGRYEPDLSDLPALVADTLLGQVAFVREGQPMVIPTAVAFEPPDGLLVHGSTGSGWMRWLATGVPAAVSITALDALVVARSAFESSMRYRSAVLFGTFEEIQEEQAKRAALDLITDTLIPGRVDEVRRPTAKELAATLVLRLRIEDATLKTNSEAWPDDPDEDVAGDVWAGIVPRRTTYGDALPAPDLREGIAEPPSVLDL
jgi:nitroimidazol reductase NimA-like FMN-containing flavoprotein (pyridoxamine 5'-phosphate oxidase superfamily)